MERPFKGPRLVDTILKLIDARGLTGPQVSYRYGVEKTWLSQVRNGRTVSPRADLCQRIYEDLTGGALIQAPREEERPHQASK